MLRWLPVAVIGLTLVEVYLLVVLGRRIGLGPTIAIIVLTGILGAVMARVEGLRVFKEWIFTLRALRSPAQGLLEGMLILVGGALLILPGLLGDAAGLLLLLPFTRRALARPLSRLIQAHIARRAVLRITLRDSGTDVMDTTGVDTTDADAPQETRSDRELPPPGL